MDECQSDKNTTLGLSDHALLLIGIFGNLLNFASVAVENGAWIQAIEGPSGCKSGRNAMPYSSKCDPSRHLKFFWQVKYY